MHWLIPTPVFLPGESQGRRSLVGCRLWGPTVGHDWGDLAAAAAATAVSNIMQYLSFSAWLISLSTIFVYVAANGRISFFLWANNIPVCVCILFILHSAETYVVSILTLLNNAAVNIRTWRYRYFFKIMILFPLADYPEIRLLTHIWVLFLNFLRSFHTFP